MSLLESGGSFAIGALVATVSILKAVWGYVTSHITRGQAQQIFTDAKKVIADYQTAKANGMNPEDELKLAQDTIALIEEIIADLEPKK